MNHTSDYQDIEDCVKLAMQEDIGSGDITVELIPADSRSRGQVISRQTAVICGSAWFDTTFKLLDPQIEISWRVRDGDTVSADQTLCELSGPSRVLLTAERTALNFLQTLSGTATLTRQYKERIKDLPVQLLDTRKTLPGLRLAQKYAVRCGGGFNHRKGLYDGVLIKENHILACGSITQAIHQAQALATNIPIEVEVENLAELREALAAGADILLLDNFDLDTLHEAVRINKGQAKLEASGGITLDTLYDIAATGVDFISVGALTKDVHAIDLSMRFFKE